MRRSGLIGRRMMRVDMDIEVKLSILWRHLDFVGFRYIMAGVLLHLNAVYHGILFYGGNIIKVRLVI